MRPPLPVRLSRPAGRAWLAMLCRTLAVAALLLGSATARADRLGEAKAHFRAGTEHYRRAQYREAITEFEAAYAAKPSGILRYNIAQCYEKLGDIPSALRNYHLYLRETPQAEDRATVQVAMSNLEKRLQERGVQQLLVYSDPSGARVSIDGRVRGDAPVAVELPPGEHEVAVSLEGYASTRRHVNISADKSVELDFALQKGSSPLQPPPRTGAMVPENEPATQPQPNLSVPPASQEHAAQGQPGTTEAAQLHHRGTEREPAASKPRLYTWVATGVAGAALAGGVIFGLSAQHNSSTMRDGTIRNQAQVQSLHDSAKNQALASNILYGVAGVAGATAVTLFFVEGKF